MPNKPSAKWGIKVLSLYDASIRYLLKFDVYTGKDPSDTMQGRLGNRVAQHFWQGFESKGHIVYMDIFCLAFPFDELIQKRTVHVNRTGMNKLKRGNLPVIFEDEDDTTLACMWQDIGRVSMLSAIGDCGSTRVKIESKKGDREVDKPSVQVSIAST